MKQYIIFCIFLKIYLFMINFDVENAALVNPLVQKLRDRVKIIDKNLNNVLVNFRGSEYFYYTYNKQFQDIDSHIGTLVGDLNQRFLIAQNQGKKNLKKCYESMLIDINRVNLTAYSESQTCQSSSFEHCVKIITSGLQIGRKLVSDLDKLEYYCTQNQPKSMETYCIAKDMPRAINCIKSYENMQKQLKNQIENSAALLKISIRRCFDNVLMKLQNLLQDVRVTTLIC